ncbi:Blue-light photoreceptor [Enhygromyxa salina]|uniref:Blue-light photoreceptor n=1 Tax=Enhygromyxa salina TaxID=215803 RepID=A0A2S9XDV7_9BACT|nr:PAS domain-containing protein [Enhygromyxa salina]PRP91044.1 Blue-light photoreceptor [Enhygromyxa salina]
MSNEVAALKAENLRLRAALDALETRGALVLEAANDGVWDWDLRTKEAVYSCRWSQVLGYADDEIANTIAAYFELIHHQDRARVQAAVDLHLETREPYAVDFRMRTKSGSWLEIQARGQAVWTEDGEPTRMAGVHTDVTERHLRERERLRNEELIAIQTDTIRALGVPILQVWKDILCLPIIGAVDEERATGMTSALLERVAATAVRFTVLDLTGAEFRADTAQYLARMTRSLRLIGGQGVLCGIGPRTAKILVDMDLDFDDVPVYRDLGDALRACLSQLSNASSRQS